MRGGGVWHAWMSYRGPLHSCHDTHHPPNTITPTTTCCRDLPRRGAGSAGTWSAVRVRKLHGVTVSMQVDLWRALLVESHASAVCLACGR